MSTATLTVRPRSSLTRLRDSVGAESTKLWSVRSTWLNLVAAALMTALLGVQYGFSTAYDQTHLPPGELAETTQVGAIAVNVVLIVQVLVAAFAMLPITSEYATGSIRSTLQWTPVRRDVVAGKAIVLAPVLFGYGLLVGLIAAVAGGLTAGQWADWDLAELVKDLVAIAAYTTLAGLFTAGIAFVIRTTAGTLTAAFLLLLVLPLMLSQSSLRPLMWLAALLPGGAGQGLLSGSTDPVPPVVSLLVLAAWAIGGLVLGLKVLGRRDA
ncbi:ABC-2 family transporter [Kribbella amoyensis]|uniref:ABC-2 family transporter n=1 Tax=Kribbella amoyensis TaxID=996641 RepID=A0A561C073_9ACTN|nr:ABC transporter permease [Kribbella amoyensis]TWD84312.1 ABC-2 family transporter [Kribbella amoyensis]